MNYLTMLLHDDFMNYKKAKRTSWSVHYMAWHYYIMISRYIKGDDNWREELKRIIAETDFSDQEIREFLLLKIIAGKYMNSAMRRRNSYVQL